MMAIAPLVPHFLARRLLRPPAAALLGPAAQWPPPRLPARDRCLPPICCQPVADQSTAATLSSDVRRAPCCCVCPPARGAQMGIAAGAGVLGFFMLCAPARRFLHPARETWLPATGLSHAPD